MNRAIDTAAAQQTGISGVHDRRYILARDVSDDDEHAPAEKRFEDCVIVHRFASRMSLSIKDIATKRHKEHKKAIMLLVLLCGEMILSQVTVHRVAQF